MTRRSGWLRRAVVGASVTWAAALPLATFVASRATTHAAPYLFAFAVYAIGGVICHQRDERSFHLWAHQMPVCARCTGIYVGAAVGALFGLVSGKATIAKPAARSWVIAAAAPAVASLVFEWTTGIMPSHLLRAATGVTMGAAVAWLVVTDRSSAVRADNVVN